MSATAVSPFKPLRLAAWIPLAVFIASAVFVYNVPPTSHSPYPKCVLYETTGLFCPTCGSTRAAYELLHFHLLNALHQNALFVLLLLPAVIWLLVRCVKFGATGVWVPLNLNPSRVLVIVLSVLIGFAVLRNLPISAFEFLRPVALK